MLFQPEYILRITLATILGAIIGYERHSRSKEAGVRTHAIVALGSAMLMLLSKYGFSDVAHFDGARIAAQVVSGIGFLGAGIIFVRHDTIQGLTTAAGIWTTSGIGLCIGAGFYEIGIVASIIIIIVQLFLQNRHIANSPRTTFRLLVSVSKDIPINELTMIIRKMGYSTAETVISKDKENPENWLLKMDITTLRDAELNKLLEELQKHPQVHNVDLAN